MIELGAFQALLRRLAHPHLAEVVGLFITRNEQSAANDSTSLFIMMPFYEHGTLDNWVRQQRPEAGREGFRQLLQEWFHT